MSVVVVGAGVSGLATAVGLHKVRSHLKNKISSLLMPFRHEQPSSREGDVAVCFDESGPTSNTC